jgi:hypothetical protein
MIPFLRMCPPFSVARYVGDGARFGYTQRVPRIRRLESTPPNGLRPVFDAFSLSILGDLPRACPACPEGLGQGVLSGVHAVLLECNLVGAWRVVS